MFRALFKILIIVGVLYFLKIKFSEYEQNIPKAVPNEKTVSNTKTEHETSVNKKTITKPKKNIKVLSISVTPTNGKAPIDVKLNIKYTHKQIKEFIINTGIETYTHDGVPPKTLDISYFKPGKYNLSVTIIDKKGKKYIATKTVTVN